MFLCPKLILQYFCQRSMTSRSRAGRGRAHAQGREQDKKARDEVAMFLLPHHKCLSRTHAIHPSSRLKLPHSIDMSPAFSFLIYLVLVNVSIAKQFPQTSFVQLLAHLQSCPVVLDPDRAMTATEGSESSPTPNVIPATGEHIHRDTASVNHKRNKLFFASRQTTHIINGALVASKRLREMMVFVVDFAQPTFCSGTLISSTWVLTAAHCQFVAVSSRAIIGSPSFTVEFGSSGHPWNITVRYDEKVAQLHTINKVINHPKFYDNVPIDIEGSYDIALVELSQPSSSNSFMKLNIDPSQPKEGSFARTTGYGQTSMIGYEDVIEASLRQVDVPVFSIEDCKLLYPGQVFPDKHVCAGYTQRFCSPCFGDSGGPMFQYDVNDNPVQLGIISLLIECGIFFDPVVNVRTDAFIKWIVEQGANFSTGGKLRSVYAEASVSNEDELGLPGTDSVNTADIDIGTGETEQKLGVVSGIVVVGFGLFLVFTIFYFAAKRRQTKDVSSAAQMVRGEAVSGLAAGSNEEDSPNQQLQYELAQV